MIAFHRSDQDVFFLNWPIITLFIYVKHVCRTFYAPPSDYRDDNPHNTLATGFDVTSFAFFCTTSKLFFFPISFSDLTLFDTRNEIGA